MEEASSPIIFAIVGAVIGFILGIGAFYLFNKGQRDNATLRQTLLERERELTALKKELHGHFSGVQQRLNSIRAEADQLEDELVERAEHWEVAGISKAHADPLADETGSKESNLPTPRDYADGKGGTLSEDFGLKERAKDEVGNAPQPPRY